MNCKKQTPVCVLRIPIGKSYSSLKGESWLPLVDLFINQKVDWDFNLQKGIYLGADKYSNDYSPSSTIYSGREDLQL